MFSKKTRNLTVAVLALVMALTLTFGLFGFNTQANAESVTDELIFSKITDPSFAEMASGTTKVYTSGQNNVFKAIAVNKAAAGTAANKTGYRADRLNVVFELKYTTNLTIYHSANSTGGRYVQLNSFESDKEVKDIVQSDYSTKTAVAFTSAKGEIFGSGVKATVTESADKKSYNLSQKGEVTITYTGLAAGKYVVIGAGSESYLYGFKLTYETAPAVTYEYTADSATVAGGTYEMYVNENLNVAGLPTTVTGTYTKKGSDNSSTTGTAQVNVVSWAFAEGNDATTDGAKTVVATLGSATVDGKPLDFSGVKPTATVNVKVDDRKTVASLNPLSAIEKNISETYTFPTTLEGLDAGGVAITANVAWTNANNEIVTTFTATAEGEFVFTATVIAGDYLYEGSIQQQLTINVADNRPAVNDFIVKADTVLVNQNANYSLPTTLEAALDNNTNAQVNVTWNTEADTTVAGTKTYTATAVADATTSYKVGNPAPTATLTLKVRPTYASIFSASWDITKVADGTAWNGEPTVKPIGSEYTLVKAQGITINAAKGTYADSKSNETVKSALDNCVKSEGTKKTVEGAETDIGLFAITVPASFKGTITVKASCYNYSSKAREAKLQLLCNNTVLDTIGAGKETNYTVLTNPNGGSLLSEVTDANGVKTLAQNDEYLMKGQKDFEFKVENTTNEPATYYINNVSYKTNKGKDEPTTIYASSIVVSGELPASKNYFYKGEKFDTLNIPGYTFLGWTSENAEDTALHAADSEVPADGNYYGVAAKLEYLGVSFRKNVNQPGVRYGFILKFYDLSDDPNSPNSLRTENLKTLGIDVSGITFNLTRGSDGKKATVTFNNDALVSAFSDEYMGYVSNLVIMGIPAAECNQTMKVDATFTITVGTETYTRNVEGVAANISEKATEAYNKGDFGNKDEQPAKDLAAKYGVTVA